jgi:hypothetical protein
MGYRIGSIDDMRLILPSHSVGGLENWIAGPVADRQSGVRAAQPLIETRPGRAQNPLIGPEGTLFG